MEADIPGSLAGERLDRVLASMTGLSRTVVAQLIVDGLVSVNGKIVTKTGLKVLEGQSLAAEIPEPEDFTPQAEANVIFRIVYEDEHLAVIDKPAGLVVHPGN